MYLGWTDCKIDTHQWIAVFGVMGDRRVLENTEIGKISGN